MSRSASHPSARARRTDPGVRRCLLRAVWLLPWPASAAAADASPALTVSDPADAGPPAATRIMEEIRATLRAEHDQVRLQSDWEQEQLRLQAVIDSAQSEADRWRRVTADAVARRQTAETAAARLSHAAAAADQLEAAARRAATQVGAALAALVPAVPPGAVTVPEAAAADALAAAAAALDATERAAETAAVEVVQGRLDGQAVVVRMLRVSGAAAWWLSLDGAHGGVVVGGGTQPTLQAASDAGSVQAIAQAIAMLDGRMPSTLIALPAPHSQAPGSRAP